MRILKEGSHGGFTRDSEAADAVAGMLDELERNGMDAVRKYSERFDGWSPDSFELSRSEIDAAIAKCSKQQIEDTEYCQENVRRFAQAQLETLQPLESEIRPGVTLGHKHIPVDTVGSYIPGGRYPMFGSAQMSIIPARVAGVREIVACTPPVKGEGPYPATIHAMAAAGADRIFVLGGVQAFALMAFGFAEVPPADILCGAGNKYVVEAKRRLYGQCGIDILAGPTEIAVIADDNADAQIVAADILGQAEHDPASGQLLVCFSERMAGAVLEEMERQLPQLPTAEIARASWSENGIVCIADSAEEAIAISDDYAPEHLELLVADPDYYLGRLRNYGSLFMGEETTVAYGDKSIGTNHILPTSRSARYTGGLWVGKFLKTVTYQRMTPEASADIAGVCARQCRAEGMIAHAVTAEMRERKYRGT